MPTAPARRRRSPPYISNSLRPPEGVFRPVDANGDRIDIGSEPWVREYQIDWQTLPPSEPDRPHPIPPRPNRPQYTSESLDRQPFAISHQKNEVWLTEHDGVGLQLRAATNRHTYERIILQLIRWRSEDSDGSLNTGLALQRRGLDPHMTLGIQFVDSDGSYKIKEEKAK